MNNIAVVFSENVKLNDKTITSLKNQSTDDFDIISLYEDYSFDEKLILNDNNIQTTEKDFLDVVLKSEYVVLFYSNIELSINFIEYINSKVVNSTNKLICIFNEKEKLSLEIRVNDKYPENKMPSAVIYERNFFIRILENKKNVDESVFFKALIENNSYYKIADKKEFVTMDNIIHNSKELIENITSKTNTLKVLLSENTFKDLIPSYVRSINYDNLDLSYEYEDILSAERLLYDLTRLLLDNKYKYLSNIKRKEFSDYTNRLLNQNNDEDMISVILAVYNMQEYIEESVDSILNQSYKNIECICVDDNSSDNTLNILKTYQKKDPRVKIIENEENIGLGASRNKALEKACGKYVQFIDADDILELNTLEDCYKLSQEHNLDVLMYKAVYFNDNYDYWHQSYFDMPQLVKYQNKLFNSDDIESKDLFKFAANCWNKFYLKRYLDDNLLSFAVDTINEDTLFFYRIILNANRLYLIDKYYYNYRRHENAITSRKDKSLLDTITVGLDIIKYFINNNNYEEYKKDLLNYSISFIKERHLLIDDKYKKDFYYHAKSEINNLNKKYKLDNEFNTYLVEEYKTYYNSIISTSNYEEYELYDKKVRDYELILTSNQASSGKILDVDVTINKKVNINEGRISFVLDHDKWLGSCNVKDNHANIKYELPANINGKKQLAVSYIDKNNIKQAYTGKDIIIYSQNTIKVDYPHYAYNNTRISLSVFFDFNDITLYSSDIISLYFDDDLLIKENITSNVMTFEFDIKKTPSSYKLHIEYENSNILLTADKIITIING